MIDCKHMWQGDSEGVKCLRCGRRLTAAEYAALFMPSTPAAPPEPKPKKKPAKKKEAKPKDV